MQVPSWSADRTARVWYRGPHWQADLVPDVPATPDTYSISAIKGARLLLAPSRMEYFRMTLESLDFSTLVLIIFLVLVLVFVIKAIAIVTQQNAWVVERLDKFDRVLSPGAGVVIPFIERVSYKHSLKKILLDLPSQVCIMRDNT